MLLYCDYANRWAMGFQDPASTWMYSLIDLHDRVIFYLIILLFVVLGLLTRSLFWNINIVYKKMIHGNTLELIWTLTPAIILFLIGYPSLKLLYMMDEIVDPVLTVKVIGHQWYWSYEYTDFVNDIAFDSFMKEDDLLELGEQRQLAVDNNLVLPIKTSLRFMITSDDVIHSFAVPSLGIKLDAIPGRLNSVGTIITRPGLYYGQCSELCGVNHGFMPIGIEAIYFPEFINWVNSNL